MARCHGTVDEVPMMRRRSGPLASSIRREPLADDPTGSGFENATPPTSRTPTSFAIAWAAAVLGAAVLRGSDDAQFERFLGVVPPIGAVAGAGLAGVASLRTLATAGWVGTDPRGKGLARSTVLAVGFGAAILVADSTLGFDEGINVSWPASLLVYPVMGFVAEVAFHLVPLALLVALSPQGRGRVSSVDHVLAPIMSVAAVEAVYQLIGSSTIDTSPWLLAYLALHMTVFGTAGLSALRRYGFASMMWLRLVYYLIWHVAWGTLRLELLF